MAANRVTLAKVAESESVPPAEVAQSATAPAPWRWWWLAVLGASAIGWALVVYAGLLLAGWRS